MNALVTAPLMTREAWLTEISDLIVAELLAPVATIPHDLRLKISVGFPPGYRPESKTIGVCFNRAASKAGFNEIFISPVIADSMKVLATLVHELIHAIDDLKSGHRGEFKRIALAVGLEGKMTATTAGDALKEKLQRYIDIFGDIPHAQMNYSGKKKQKTRMIKVGCLCGFSFRTSMAQIDFCVSQTGGIACPVCNHQMQVEI